MKKLLWGLVLLVGIASCDDNDDDNTKNSDTKIAEVESRAGNGQFRITYFVEDAMDQTSSFNGYIFEFDDGGLVTVTNGSENHTGLWAVTGDDSNDDSNGYDGIDFNVEFTSPNEFEELNEDWEIITLSATKMELMHKSGGDGNVDYLTFERI